MKNRHILFLCDRFRITDIGIDLIANAFRGSIQNTRLFPVFSSFIFCFIIYLSAVRNGAYSCLPSKNSLLFIIFIQRMVSLMVIIILFITKCFLFVYMYIDLLKLTAYKLFENSYADLSLLMFICNLTELVREGPIFI